MLFKAWISDIIPAKILTLIPQRYRTIEKLGLLKLTKRLLLQLRLARWNSIVSSCTLTTTTSVLSGRRLGLLVGLSTLLWSKNVFDERLVFCTLSKSIFGISFMFKNRHLLYWKAHWMSRAYSLLRYSVAVFRWRDRFISLDTTKKFWKRENFQNLQF